MASGTDVWSLRGRLSQQGRAQLPQRRTLQLTDSLLRQPKLSPDLLQGLCPRAAFVEMVAPQEDGLFPLRQQGVPFLEVFGQSGAARSGRLLGHRSAGLVLSQRSKELRSGQPIGGLTLRQSGQGSHEARE